MFGLDLAGEGEDGGAGVAGVEVGGEDDRVLVVELQGDGGAAAERGEPEARAELGSRFLLKRPRNLIVTAVSKQH